MSASIMNAKNSLTDDHHKMFDEIGKQGVAYLPVDYPDIAAYLLATDAVSIEKIDRKICVVLNDFDTCGKHVLTKHDGTEITMCSQNFEYIPTDNKFRVRLQIKWLNELMNTLKNV